MWRLSLICLLLLSSCGTFQAYDGPQRPKDEIATLITYSGPANTITVSEIDGVAVRSGVSFNGRLLPPANATVLPGRHTLRVSYDDQPGVARGRLPRYRGTIDVEVAPGRTYELRAASAPDDGTAEIWVVDASNEVTVASTVGKTADLIALEEQQQREREIEVATAKPALPFVQAAVLRAAADQRRSAIGQAATLRSAAAGDAAAQYLASKLRHLSTAKRFRWACLAAYQDHAAAQASLATYARYGMLQRADLAEAYKWLSLSAANEADPANQIRIKGQVDQLVDQMTAAEITAAEQLFRVWRPNTQSCGTGPETPIEIVRASR